MSADHTRNVLRASLRLLSAISPDPPEVRVQIEGGKTTLRLVAAREDLESDPEEIGATPGAPPPGMPSAALWLSEEEAAIVGSLPEVGYLSTRQIADKAGLSPDGDIRVLLRNLVARGILESVQGRGFCRALGEDPCPS